MQIRDEHGFLSQFQCIQGNFIFNMFYCHHFTTILHSIHPSFHHNPQVGGLFEKRPSDGGKQASLRSGGGEE